MHSIHYGVYTHTQKKKGVDPLLLLFVPRRLTYKHNMCACAGVACMFFLLADVALEM